MFREDDSLSKQFKYQATITGARRFVVIASYFDDSEDETTGVVTCAGAIAHEENWLNFEGKWREEMVKAGVTDYHAQRRDRGTQALSALLPGVAIDCGVIVKCVAIQKSHYDKHASAIDKSQIGNVYGFAVFAAALVIAETLSQSDAGDAWYYIDQGGAGFAKVMEIFGQIYSDDEDRQYYRMAGFGSADRRKHLPLHPADMVAHEVATDRDRSEPLKAFLVEDDLQIVDLTEDSVISFLELFRKVMREHKQEKQRRKNERYRGRKERHNQ